MKWILVDRILQCEPGKSVTAVKNIPSSDPLFKEHFPGYPVVPGVLQIEMIAHAGSRCIALSDIVNLAILGSVKSAKFYRPVGPDQDCVIKVEILSLKSSHALAQGYIEVDNERVCSAELMFAMIPRTKLDANHKDAVLAEWRSRNERETSSS